ncbi:unnamed protein product [Calypogeia fissa]
MMSDSDTSSDGVEEVLPAALNSKLTTRKMYSNDGKEVLNPTTLNSKFTTREMNSDMSRCHDIEEVFASAALSSKFSWEMDSDASSDDVEEVFPTSSFQGTSREMDSNAGRKVLPTMLNSKFTTRETDSNGGKEMFPSILNSKFTNREMDSDDDVEKLFPKSKSTTREIGSNVLEEKFPMRQNAKSPIREVDSDGSDPEEVLPTAKLPLSEDGRRLFRIRRTVMAILWDRGYLVSKAELVWSEAQFSATFGSEPSRGDLKICTVKISNREDRVVVLFAEPTEKTKVGKKTVEDCAVAMTHSNSRRAILVVQKPLTLGAKQFLDAMDKKYQVEVFQEAELLVNIMDSEFVPKHEILLPEEKKAVMEKYHIPDGKEQRHLPKLLQTDPVARYLGLEKGQVIRIIRRPGGSAAGDLSAQDQAITYRVVI